MTYLSDLLVNGDFVSSESDIASDELVVDCWVVYIGASTAAQPAQYHNGLRTKTAVARHLLRLAQCECPVSIMHFQWIAMESYTILGYEEERINVSLYFSAYIESYQSTNSGYCDNIFIDCPECRESNGVSFLCEIRFDLLSSIQTRKIAMHERSTIYGFPHTKVTAATQSSLTWTTLPTIRCRSVYNRIVFLKMLNKENESTTNRNIPVTRLTTTRPQGTWFKSSFPLAVAAAMPPTHCTDWVPNIRRFHL